MPIDFNGPGVTPYRNPSNPFNNLGKAVHHTTQVVRRLSKPTVRSSRGRSSGGSSRGNISRSTPRRSYTPAPRPSVPKVVAPAPKPKPVVPSINSYLGTDAAYQQALSSGKRSLTDYIADINRRRGEATTQYNQTQSSMEQDRAQQLDALRQEFASRGLINSGLFGQEQGKFQQQYNDQLNSLGQQQAGLLADLVSQQTNYQNEYNNAIEQAKQEALARRAAKYGLTS